MKKIILGGSILAGVMALPALVFAQVNTGNQAINPSYLTSITTTIGTIITAVVPILVGLAVVYFLWGMVKYIIGSGDPDKEKESRGIMIYGVIGIFVMVSIWGLVTILQNIFSVSGGTAITLQVPSMNS